MNQGRRQGPPARGNENFSTSESVRPPAWIGASGRVYHDPPPLVGMRLNEPMMTLPENPPLRVRLVLPIPTIVDQTVRLVGNMPIIPFPLRDPNAVLNAPPICVIMRIFTGNNNEIREWAEIIPDIPTFEVTGYLHAIGMINPDYPPALGNEINLLLRDRAGTGPILQVIHPFYLSAEMPADIQTGQLIRCVGRFLDARRMLALKISIVR